MLGSDMLEVAIGLRRSNDLEKRATELLNSIPDEQAASAPPRNRARATGAFVRDMRLLGDEAATTA